MRRLATALLVLGACGGDIGGNDGDDDAPTFDATPGSGSDASVVPKVDAMPATSCLDEMPADYGDPTPVDSSNYSIDMNYTYYADLVPDPQRFQRLFISLHPEMGVFSGAVVPGTYTLEGEETDFAWCGACVYLAVDDDGSAPSVLYMASDGKLRVDSVDTDIHGELTDATFVQIGLEYTGPSCAGGGEWPCGNAACSGATELCEVQEVHAGCVSAVDSLTF